MPIPKNVRYYDSTAYEASAVIKSSQGGLYSLTGYNSLASPQFIQFHDAAALPADAEVPANIFSDSAKPPFFYELGDFGRLFIKGIVVCNSSTGPTKTIGANDCWFNAQYK